MSKQHSMVTSHQDSDQGTLRTYITGFVFSIVLTLLAYFMVVDREYSKWTVAIAIALMAVLQFIVQLVFFLHLGRESKPRWRVGVFLFMLLVVFIVVVGSLWIMYNLNYRMVSKPDINKYLQTQDGGI